MEEKQCKLCSTPTDSSSSRPFDGSRICSRCRWRIEPKCAVKGCSTLQKKQSILKQLPNWVSELAPAAKLHLNLKYGLTAQTNKCCASCYLKLHRASAEISAMLKNKDSCLPSELPKVGRPPTPYEEASKRTKEKIIKKAEQLQATPHII